MKYAFIVTNITGGGAEKAILKICSGLAQRGHDVNLVLLEHIVTHDVPAGIPVHALTSPGARLSKGMIGKWLAARRLRRLMARLAEGRPFDLIVSTLPFADEVAVRAGLPRHWCRIANTLSAEIDLLRSRNAAKARRRRRRYRRLYGSRALIAVSASLARVSSASITHSISPPSVPARPNPRRSPPVLMSSTWAGLRRRSVMICFSMPGPGWTCGTGWCCSRPRMRGFRL